MKSERRWLLAGALLFACAPREDAESPPPVVRPTPQASATTVTARTSACRDLVAARARAEYIDAGSPDAAARAEAGAPRSDADVVIASLRTDFRACYNEGLRADPRMEGCVVMRTRVSPEGDVAANETYARDGLSESVAECLVATVRRAKFSPPGGTGATLMVPVTFIQGPKK